MTRVADNSVKRRRAPRWAPVASLVLCALVSACHLSRAWFLDPITIWPFWFATGIGLLLALPGLFGSRKMFALAVGAWLLATALIAEESRHLLRPGPQPTGEVGRTLRIVTINCAGGRDGAFADALALDPDIIAVQERPGTVEMQEMCGSDGWLVAPGIDTAIVARGSGTWPELHKHLAHYMQYAIVSPERLNPPVTLTVFSVHLHLPGLRMDPWNPKTWREARTLRRVREESVALLMQYVHTALAQGPVIIAGDFNTPGRNSLLDPLREDFTDAFAAVGRGWPNTITAEHPMSRIDGIWVSGEMRPLHSRVVYTEHSDHRMVVTDVQLR